MEQLHQILQLPEKCLLNKKLTKAFFKRNFQLTLSERKLLDDANIIQQIEWFASIKPQNANIAKFEDAEYIFEEIQVITVLLNDDALEKNAHRVIELIQKYIPYPIFLVLYNAHYFLCNTANKRINLNDTSKRTIQSMLSTNVISCSHPTQNQTLFMNQLAFHHLDKQHLKTCYQSYEGNLASLQISSLTGAFIGRPAERAICDVLKLDEIKKLQSEIASIKSKAMKETNLSTQVQLNNQVIGLQQKINILTAEISNL